MLVGVGLFWTFWVNVLGLARLSIHFIYLLLSGFLGHRAKTFNWDLVQDPVFSTLRQLYWDNGCDCMDHWTSAYI